MVANVPVGMDFEMNDATISPRAGWLGYLEADPFQRRHTIFISVPIRHSWKRPIHRPIDARQPVIYSSLEVPCHYKEGEPETLIMSLLVYFDG